MTTDNPGPFRVGQTLWISSPFRYARVRGWYRQIITDAEADAVNAAVAEGRPPYLPDIAKR